jgi:trimeric autotransporter adhesin
MKSFVLIFITIVLLSLTHQAQIITEGLIGYWPFEGNANDFSENNYHGTVNGAVLGIDRFNNPNNSYFFDGIDDCIAIYYDAPLNINQSLTISFWFNTHDPSPNNFSMPVAIAQTYDLRLFYTLFNKNSDVYDIMFRLFTDPDNPDYLYSNLDFYTLTKKCSCFDEKWHHYVGIYDADDETAYLYLDNELVSMNHVGPFDFQINTVPITVGCYMKLDGSGFRGFYKGYIDDLMLFTRALSVDEINDLFFYFPTESSNLVNETVTINPNPSNGNFRLSLGYKKKAHSKYVIKIISAAGQLVTTIETESNIFDISIKDSPYGLYLLQIYNDTGKLICTEKIVKQ